MGKAVVLLSAGLDSTYNLWRAKDQMDVVLALTFDYGHRAALREIDRSKQQCDLLNIEHQTVNLPWFSSLNASALIDRQLSIPRDGDVSIDDLGQSQVTAKAVWVPNRNGIFLNIAAGFAEQRGAGWIIPGFNAEEAATFPDNSKPYMDALSNSLFYSTANHVKVMSFSDAMNKTEIMMDALALGVRLDLVWSCYYGDVDPCGRCESCQRFLRAARSSAGAAARLSQAYQRLL
jgi:7-cyano-7-deazaguanine synthase